MAKKKYLEITDEELGAIYDQGKEVTVSFLRVLIDKINDLEEQIVELRDQISKNSKNSNTPPSKDDPYKKQTKSLRIPGGKIGGQSGHPGNNLKQTEHPDSIVKIKTKGSCRCGESIHRGEIIGYSKRQVFDLPKIKVSVTEIQAEMRRCACGVIHTAEFPENVTMSTQYGENLQALVVYLKYHGFLSYERISEFMSDVLNQNISQGTLVNIVNNCAQRMKPATDKIRNSLKTKAVVHFDETGVRVKGLLQWLHSAGTAMLTYYFPHINRGKTAMDAMGILPSFEGIAVHDHWDSYYRYENCTHSLCNAHHLRELIFFSEQKEVWAEKIITCLLDAKKETSAGLIVESRIKYYRNKMGRLLNEGLLEHPEAIKQGNRHGRVKQSKATNLLLRLKNDKNDVLRFVTDHRVPFDNNLAERDIRMVKVQQKVSGSFRSSSGAESFCTIRSFLSTARKQGHSLYEAIFSTFRNDDLLSY